MAYSLSSARTIFELILLGILFLFTIRRSIVGFVTFLFVSAAWMSLQKFNPYLFVEWHLLRVIAIFTLLMAVVDVMRRRVRFFAPAQNWLMIALFSLMCLSRTRAGLSLDHQSISDFFRMVLLYFIITGTIDSRDKLKYAIWALIFGFALESWTAFSSLRSGMTSEAVPVWGYDKNSFALYLVMGVPLVATFLLDRKMLLTKVLLTSFLVLLLITIVRTYSRGGYLGLAVVLFLLMIGLIKKRNWRIAIIFLAPLLLFVFIRLTPESAWERWGTITTYEEDISAYSRVYFWKAGINMMKDNPHLGVGAGNFGAHLPYYMDMADPREREYRELLITDRQKRSPHNMFILIGAENGIIALMIWISILLKTLFDARYVARNSIRDTKGSSLADIEFALTTGLAGWLVCGFFLSPIYGAIPHAFIAMVAASRNVVNKEREALTDKENKKTQKVNRKNFR